MPARRASDVWVFVLIFCVSLIVYWPAVDGALLWDDTAHITPPDLQSLDGLRRIWLERQATQQYYPLLHTAFWVEHQLWGDSVAGYHLTNILLHAFAACLLVVIVRGFRRPAAPLAGLLFALHPVCVEAVAWISEQKSTLSAVFYLASALVYLRFDRDRRKPQYFLAFGLFVLALFSKTVTATLPVALLIVLWWQRGRVEWKRDIAPLVPWVFVGAAAGLFTAWVERTDIGAQGADFNLSIGQRVLIAGRALWFYLGKQLWPSNLTFIYPRWDIRTDIAWQYLFPVGAVLILIWFAILARRGQRGPLSALLYFVVTLFPVLGFLNVFPFIYSFVADHFQYLAGLAVVIPAAILLTDFANRLHGTLRAIVPMVIPLTFATLTWRQSAMYRNPETFYRETLRRNPSAWMAHNNLANLLAHVPGCSDEALQEYQAAVRLKPDYAEAHYNLANLLIREDPESAIAHYRDAVRFKPDFADAHANLATALARTPSRLPEAVAQYQEAIRLQPGLAVTHFDLANALSRMPDRSSEAITEYQKAIELNPDFLEARYNLALALAKFPVHSQEAIEQLEVVLRMRPDLADARNLLARLREKQR